MSYSVPPLPSRPVPREVFTDPVLTKYRSGGMSRERQLFWGAWIKAGLLLITAAGVIGGVVYLSRLAF